MPRLALTLLCVVAMLFAADPPQAIACECAPPSWNDAAGRNAPPFVAAPHRVPPPPVATATKPAGRPYGDDIMDAHNNGPRWFFPAMTVALLLAATGVVVTLTRRRR